jgi:RNA polymerase sigma factor (sigma-70 family)
MAKEEAILLQRFVATGDAAAFSEIVRRHVKLVYGTCMRILADADKAADATQETFFQLLKKAGTITGSLAAWLHRVATCKALDAVRSESARRRLEDRYADDTHRQADTWENLAPHVDQALDALDEPTRDLLVQYFFEARSLTDIGAEKGVSCATVSRHLKAAIDKLARQLRRRGIIVASVTISSLFSENAVAVAPSAVMQELAKMTLGGAKLTTPAAGTATAGSVAAVGGLLLAAKTKVIVVVAVISIGAAGVLTYRHFSRPPDNADPQADVDSLVPSPRIIAQTQSPTEASTATTAPRVEPDTPAETASEELPPAQTQPVKTELAAVPDQSQDVPQADETPAFDLSTPEAAVRTFTRVMAAGDADAVLACFVPNGEDYEDIQEILYADPSDPARSTNTR